MRDRGASQEQWDKATENKRLQQEIADKQRKELEVFLSTFPDTVNGMEIDKKTGEVEWCGNYITSVKIGTKEADLVKEIKEIMQYI